jgi:hypothetical protein
MREPRSFTTLWASTACYRNSFTIFLWYFQIGWVADMEFIVVNFLSKRQDNNRTPTASGTACPKQNTEVQCRNVWPYGSEVLNTSRAISEVDVELTINVSEISVSSIRAEVIYELKLKLKSIYDRQSVGQSVLV